MILMFLFLWKNFLESVERFYDDSDVFDIFVVMISRSRAHVKQCT